MRYRVLSFCLGWIAQLGCWLSNFLEHERRTHFLARAIPAGTPVVTSCPCHNGKRWYIRDADASFEDYRLVAQWPVTERQTFHATRDVDYIESVPAKYIKAAE